MAATWSMFSRDPDYRVSGGLPLISAKGVTRHMGVDAAVVEFPLTGDTVARTAPGCGVVLRRNGRQEFAGLIGPSRTLDQDRDGKPTVKALCVGDTVHLEDRLVYPDPTRAGDDQTTVDYWTRNVPATTAMGSLINEQLGPGARPERRVPTLYPGTAPGSGVTRPWAFMQTDTVLSACQQISALSGVNPGVRMVSTPDGLRFDIYSPRQLADDIRFSSSLRNLVAFSYTDTAPTLTYVVAAGQGDLRNRMRRAATSTNPLDLRWGRRIEQLLDRRDEPDGTKLQTAADDALADGVGQVSLACTLTDSQTAAYGRDWGLGDRVTVYVGIPGVTTLAVLVDVVREVAFTVDDDGVETLTPAIGTTDASAFIPSPTQQRIAAIGDALRDLRRK